MVIPVYNGECYICRAIDSVLAQSYRAIEIIVVDDGSTDATADKVKCYGDKVRYIYQDNAGVSAARNKGIIEAECEWVAFLDGDDEWLADHLSNQKTILSDNPDLVWSTANYYDFLESEGRKGLRCTKSKAGQYVHVGVMPDYFLGYMAGVSGNTDTMIVKREVLIEQGMFAVGRVKAEDIDLWWKIAIKYPKIGYAIEPGSIYYIDVGEGHVSKSGEVDTFIEVIQEHLAIAKKSGQEKRYEPFAAWQLARWMRSMLFSARKADIRKLLKEFSAILPATVKLRYYSLTIFPGLTKQACHLISKFVRTFKLRRRVVNKPPIG